MKKNFLLSLMVCIIFLPGIVTGKKTDVLKEYSDIASELRKANFSLSEIQTIFSDPRITTYPDLFKPPPKGVPTLYKPYSICRGQEILERNAVLWQKIEEQFGVERQIMVSLYRVETDLGEYLGKHLVFNTLLTYIRHRHRNYKSALANLVAFQSICRQYKIDNLGVVGSRSGAFGLWQFMPATFPKFALDANYDGKIDLFEFNDAAYSAANFLKRHGWQYGISIDEEVTKKHVLYRYNPSLDYVNMVLKYSKLITSTKPPA